MDDLYGLPEKLESPEEAPIEIVDMANVIREAHHKSRLAAAEIRYVIIPGSISPDVKTSLAKVKRVGNVERAVLHVHFIISINWTAWQQLTDKQRKAVLDHELTHCEKKLNDKGEHVGWMVRKHDIEDFVDIIERHGLWTEDLELAGAAIMKQQELFVAAEAS